jgi:hypothetical protein
MAELTDLDHAKRGAAMLTALVVQTLNESDPSFQRRFLEKLGRAYQEVKDNHPMPVKHELELFSWTRSLLTGFDWGSGQGKPFLAD